MLSVWAVARMAARYICHTTRRFLLRIRLSPIEIERMPRSRITFEANRQPFGDRDGPQAISACRLSFLDPLETEFEKRTIMDFEQPIRAWMRKSGSIPIWRTSNKAAR